ncbi:Mss4-like protein [Hypoxylon sp. FL1150]|nr:Mss4-like protein [Hypoxylon sp. FL1150]
MAKVGGCFCGKIRISYEGEPVKKALCHCLDCRKITGSTYSTNIIVPGAGFKVLSGTPKTLTKKADSGKDITSHFCGDCGSTLYRDGPSFGDNKVIKVGVLDDPKALDEAKPDDELYDLVMAQLVDFYGKTTS